MCYTRSDAPKYYKVIQAINQIKCQFKNNLINCLSSFWSEDLRKCLWGILWYLILEETPLILLIFESIFLEFHFNVFQIKKSESDKMEISTKLSAALSTQLFFLLVSAIPNFSVERFFKFSRINQVFMAQFNESKSIYFYIFIKLEKYLSIS